MGPIACSCAGGPTPARQEKFTHAFLLKRALEKEYADSFEVTVVNLGDEREYEEGITRLKRYVGRVARSATARRSSSPMQQENWERMFLSKKSAIR